MARLLVLLLICSLTTVSLGNAYPSDSRSLYFKLSLKDLETDQQYTITGTVKDAATGESLAGVTVLVKGTTNGQLTDVNGRFSILIPGKEAVLIFSSIGFTAQEIRVTEGSVIRVALAVEVKQIDEVVVIGYGTQKKASVVGAISVTSGAELKRTGGVTNFAQTLTGQIPGLVTIQTTGYPGVNKPIIYIRGQSTWNGGQPYILVDGIERSMSDLDANEVESVSVLKDASATAVYGVKGANGVILITTRRGVMGKPKLTFTANTTIDIPSKIPRRLDSFDALMVKNESIEREVVLNEASWGNLLAYPVVKRFQSPVGLKYPEAYPNVNWDKEMLKDYSTSRNFNLNLSGGSKNVRYFTSLAYTHEGDLMKARQSDKGYQPGFGYDRFNFRSNLDFDLTKTTTFSMNLGGYFGNKQDTYTFSLGRIWNALYTMPPDAMQVKYSDGTYGYSPLDLVNMINSAASISETGIRKQRRTELDSDFKIDQKLDFITKGLSLKGTFSFDNTFYTEGGLTEGVSSPTEGGNTLFKYIDPAIEDAPDGANLNSYIYYTPTTTVGTQFEFTPKPWWPVAESALTGNISRRMNYQITLNYLRSFGKHNVTALGLFSREQSATGSMFPRYREDWVFRTTYDYNSKYFLEVNGAYNGSEQFGPGYRFQLFPSIALGWMISKEPFFNRSLGWIEKLKVRASHGIIGDDNVGSRWGYISQWGYGGSAQLGQFTTQNSPYTFYRQSTIGNPNLHWEVAKKTDFGIEASALNGLISGNADYFIQRRNDIILDGGSQAVPDFFGGSPPVSNLGKVIVKGYEIELGSRYRTASGIIFGIDINVARAVDKILFRDDPTLMKNYRKQAGFPIDQTRSQVSTGFYNNWDQVFASVPLESNDAQKLPGYYNLLDFNGDGVINSFDVVPVGYPMRPQNSYSLTLRTEYKGFRFQVQFYGVTNCSRNIPFDNFPSNMFSTVYDQGDYWSKDNLNASSFLPRWKTQAESIGDYYIYDASYLRLKTAELSYTLKESWTKRMNMSGIRLFVSGNNLLFWSKLPDDRESSTTLAEGDGKSYAATAGTYPTMKRINFGLELTF